MLHVEADSLCCHPKSPLSHRSRQVNAQNSIPMQHFTLDGPAAVGLLFDSNNLNTVTQTRWPLDPMSQLTQNSQRHKPVVIACHCDRCQYVHSPDTNAPTDKPSG
jgi:hypothetical protein